VYWNICKRRVRFVSYGDGVTMMAPLHLPDHEPTVCECRDSKGVRVRIAWDDDTGYISYVRADIPVLILFIVETSILAHQPRSETTSGYRKTISNIAKLTVALTRETSVTHKDIRDLEALTCSDVGLDQHAHMHCCT